MKTRNLIFPVCIACVAMLSYACASSILSQITTTTVAEEGGVNFVKITDESDAVGGSFVGTYIPTLQNYVTTNVGTVARVSYNGNVLPLRWFDSQTISISPDGQQIAYISSRNGTKNVIVRSTDRKGSAIQRTFRNNVLDVRWSPDGKTIAFSEGSVVNGSVISSIYTINASGGSVVQKITNGATFDHSPMFSNNGETLFFTRSSGGESIWSYSSKNGLFSSYSAGSSPCTVQDNDSELLCSRLNSDGRYEIWRINYDTGVEQVILSQKDFDFFLPNISPNGKWIVCVGTSLYFLKENQSHSNMDLFAIRTDGTQLTQLTFHPGDDCSPIWAPDGKSIYFISQRGSVKGEYNIWKMAFPLE